MRIQRCYEARWQSGAAKPFSALRRALLQRTSRMRQRSRGFTLVELILVMTLLVIGVSFVAPQLGGFFRGRTMQAEGRRLISMAHGAQSRAVSGGVPVILWIDKEKNSYGIQEEPGYTDKDPKAEEYALNENLKIDVAEDDSAVSQPTTESTDPHMNLPHITFLPDGTIGDGSPRKINIVDNNGPKVSVAQTRDRSQYEISTTTEEQ